MWRNSTKIQIQVTHYELQHFLVLTCEYSDLEIPREDARRWDKQNTSGEFPDASCDDTRPKLSDPDAESAICKLIKATFVNLTNFL